MKTRRIDLTELRFDDMNANAGTEFGASLLERSLRDDGAARSIVCDASENPVVIAGNKTLQAAINAGFKTAIVVESAGDEIVCVQRRDVLIDSKRGRRLAVADNRINQVGLKFDNDVLIQLNEVVDLGHFGFDLGQPAVEMPEIEFSFGGEPACESFGVLIMCESADAQAALIARLNEQGIKAVKQ